MSRHLILVLFAAVCVACGKSPAEPSSDAGSAVADVGGPDTSFACSTKPTTYLEIINACTDAQAIEKDVDLSPMSLPDGGLQPLP
jgi:hypothetical protein